MIVIQLSEVITNSIVIFKSIYGPDDSCQEDIPALKGSKKTPIFSSSELIDLCEPAFRRSQGEVSEGPGSETESRRDLILSKIADCTAAGENAAKLWAQLKREENKKVTVRSIGYSIR